MNCGYKCEPIQLMFTKVFGTIGLSALLNVVAVNKPGPKNATTLLQNTVVQTVMKRHLKLEPVTLTHVQVID